MIRKGALVIIGCFSCLMLIFSAGSAYATSTSMSGAFIDWDTFDYSFIGTTGADITDAISWEWEESYSEAEAWDDDDDDDDDDWAEEWGDTSALAEVDNALGYGWTGWSDILGLVDIGVTDVVGEIVWAEANGLDTEYAYSWAMAERYGEFEVFDTGDLTLSVDYFLAQGLSTEFLDEYAYGWSFAGLDLYNFESEGYDYADDWLEYEVRDGDTYYDYACGTLTVTVGFEDGDSGDFYAWVENEADVGVVPEPATLSLLGLGLLGFIGIKNKKAKRS